MVTVGGGSPSLLSRSSTPASVAHVRSDDTLRILVIEHERDVDLGLIADRLTTAGLTADVVGPERGVTIPTSLEGYAGLIVLGGTMDPVDDSGAPWLPRVRDLLGAAVRDQVPTMGVCLGAQLLGMTVGGEARLIPAGPEVGLVTMRPTEAAACDPLLGLLPAGGRSALAWHWWEVVRLPDVWEGHRVTILAESDACSVHAFSVGSSVWGIQFHLEALGETATRWASDHPDRLRRIGIEPVELVAEVISAEDELVASWSLVVDAWASVVRERESGAVVVAG